jgi:hypothetical protein
LKNVRNFIVKSGGKSLFFLRHSGLEASEWKNKLKVLFEHEKLWKSSH